MTEQPHRAREHSANPSMLLLARGSRGFTQQHAASLLGWSESKLSKQEAGVLSIGDDDLISLSHIYGYPADFFSQSDSIYGFATCCQYHRKRQMPVRQLSLIHDRINILRMRIARLLRGAVIKSEHQFDSLDIDEFGGSPERIAQLVRASWRLPMGPIRNLVAAIESAGGVVIQCSFGTTKLDAVSQWAVDTPPLFFINSEIPVDRWRFTLAHEIGHIVMHGTPTPYAEREADQFASEFLMPKAMIEHDLQNITLERAAALKPFWRVSMQALIRRAKDVGAITPRRYTSLCAYLSKLGYRKNEPITIANEKPRVLADLIDFHLNEQQYDQAGLARLLLSTEDELREQFLGARNQPLRIHNGGNDAVEHKTRNKKTAPNEAAT